ncbi:hypothetical protein ACFLWO_00705 [Chloroflexota bacterium]
MPFIQLDLSHLSRIEKLFIPGNSTDTLVISLEGLGAELSNRVGAFKNAPNSITSLSAYLTRASKLAEAISYTSDRLTDVLARHRQIRWMRHSLDYSAVSDAFAQAEDPTAAAWRIFLGLAIKDFHLDISSLMDSLAPVIIQVNGELKPGDTAHLPGWKDIKNKGKYRKQISSDMADIVDKSERWWASIKEVRNLVAHRKHDRIVYGNPEDGLLFQIYDQVTEPKIKIPYVLHQPGSHVIDFDLYSAWVTAEVIILLDDLGTAIGPTIPIPQAIFAQMNLRWVEKSVAQSIDGLIQLANKPKV